MALPPKILIVGGGVFGLSTALSLSRRHPTSEVTVLEASPIIPNPEGSSVDASRIVRADYSHPVYTKLADAAIERWRNTEWGAEDNRYIQSGLLLVYPEGNTNGKEYARKSYNNVKELGNDVELLPSKKDVLRVAHAYGEELNVAGGYVNWGSGWSDAEAGVRYAKKLLDTEGKVTFKTGEVKSLLYADQSAGASQRKVTGVLLEDGSSLTADLVVLATGAWTGKLVDLRGRALSTGQAVAFVQISDEEQRRLEHMPTILNFATGFFIIPPRKNLLKIARHAYGYINPKNVPVPGVEGETMQVSLPEPGVPVPLEGEEALRSALRNLLPSMGDRPFIHTRVCCGHGYKFLPVLGDKIVDAMEGKLEPELSEIWKWPAAVEGEFEGDGSRSGPKGLRLMDELAKTKKAQRKGVL
ncbi:unnamed protein product [Aspergillus oryzae]|uniref:Unnamed protein product n=2 Tax=Aspergillus oryzae TaxID=5062 RepID=A0AAN5BVF3_ASPOZ|nr:unnamed protein product [Aspergillus oryzae]GMF85766.1 unnamed protein product [Aspergillus oryzae]GMG01306.1 unnamed protein product [Aspergillus oryzae]GMG27210.1 unnamed protein product [Aspergillus oryzae]GMG51802.1 unnamed protein product [Aspergillus oryzae var. brunneus]